MQVCQQGVLVTGGASGIGLAVAKFFQAQGNSVTILDSNEKAYSIAKECGFHAFVADVTSETAIDEVFAQIKLQTPALRICINCAGIAPAKRVVGKQGVMPLADFNQVIAVNLIGTFNVIRQAAALMSQLSVLTESGERGVIINTASIAAYEGQIGQTAYAASKGGIVAMTLPLAREFAQYGIRVNTIAPGLVATPLLLGMPPEVQASLAQQVPFPARFALPEEYAKLAFHIAENEMINGEVIRLDGAMRMQPR